MKIRIMKTTEHGSRPATGDELSMLEEKDLLYINYYVVNKPDHLGKVWIQLDKTAENDMGFYIDED